MSYRAVGLTPEQMEYVRLALSHLKGWGDHPDYEDLIGEALLGAFQAVAEEQESGKNLKSVAFVGAGSAIKNFWRAKGRKKRTGNVVQLEDLCKKARWQDPIHQCWRETSVKIEAEPSSSDFSNDLIEEIVWEQQLQSLLNSFEAKVMRMTYLEGMSGAEVAAAEGVTRKRIYNVIYNATRKLRAGMEQLG